MPGSAGAPGPRLDQQRADTAERQWAAAAARLLSEFDSKKVELQKLRDRHNEIVGQYASERQVLEGRAREMQLNQFLQQTFISDHKIAKIGPGRTATLASYGIETAFDVLADRIRAVPGFKRKLTQRLVQWRRTIESQFVFNAVAGIPPRELQPLEMRFAPGRLQVEAALLAGEQELKAISARRIAALVRGRQAL